MARGAKITHTGAGRGSPFGVSGDLPHILRNDKIAQHMQRAAIDEQLPIG
jgi:hypothetical protein